MDIEYIKQHFPFFKAIYTVYEPSKGVAWTSLKKRALYLNNAKWLALPFEHKFFVLAHEEGHNVLHTKDELAADAYAYDKYEKQNFSNVEAVKALQLHLDNNNPVHKARIWQQYQRALKNSFYEHGKESAYRKHYTTINETKKILQKNL